MELKLRISAKILAFTNHCLRNILDIRWPNTSSNEDLLVKTQEERMTTQIRRKKWKWIGHMLRKPHNNIGTILESSR